MKKGSGDYKGMTGYINESNGMVDKVSSHLQNPSLKLYNLAGIKFDFSEQNIKELAEFVLNQYKKL